MNKKWEKTGEMVKFEIYTEGDDYIGTMWGDAIEYEDTHMGYMYCITKGMCVVGFIHNPAKVDFNEAGMKITYGSEIV